MSTHTIMKDDDVISLSYHHGTYKLIISSLFDPSFTVLAAFTKEDARIVQNPDDDIIYVDHHSNSLQCNYNVDISMFNFETRTLGFRFESFVKRYTLSEEEWELVTSFEWR